MKWYDIVHKHDKKSVYKMFFLSVLTACRQKVGTLALNLLSRDTQCPGQKNVENNRKSRASRSSGTCYYKHITMFSNSTSGLCFSRFCYQSGLFAPLTLWWTISNIWYQRDSVQSSSQIPCVCVRFCPSILIFFLLKHYCFVVHNTAIDFKFIMKCPFVIINLFSYLLG